jgi:hypothetical protein
MKLIIKLDVKFRAFGMDFAKWNQTFVEPLPAPAGDWPHRVFLNWTKNGVTIVGSFE